MDSAKFGNEAHFMSFAAIIATRNGTEGSNFHIRNTMTAIVEVSGNRLVCIVACDRATVLAKPSPQTGRCLTPDEGPSLETSIFALSFQVVREPLPFAYH